jgi:hypothetical protein
VRLCRSRVTLRSRHYSCGVQLQIFGSRSMLIGIVRRGLQPRQVVLVTRKCTYDIRRAYAWVVAMQTAAFRNNDPILTSKIASSRACRLLRARECASSKRRCEGGYAKDKGPPGGTSGFLFCPKRARNVGPAFSGPVKPGVGAPGVLLASLGPSSSSTIISPNMHSDNR